MRNTVKGLTLVELLIAIIGLGIILAGIASLMSTSHLLYYRSIDNLKLQDEASFAMAHITKRSRNATSMTLLPPITNLGSGNRSSESIRLNYPNSQTMAYRVVDTKNLQFSTDNWATFEVIAKNISKTTFIGNDAHKIGVDDYKHITINIDAAVKRAGETNLLQLSGAATSYQKGESVLIKNITSGTTYQTISGAVSGAITGDVIGLLENWIYDEGNITVNKGITIRGGYDQNFSTADPVNKPSTIRDTADTPVVTFNTVGTKLDGLIINK